MWPSLEPGDLRHVIQIQQRTTAPDPFGQPQPTWTTVLNTWSKIETLTLRELYQSGQFTSQVTHTITLRFPAVTISPGMRAVFAGHTYIVQAANNLEQRNTVLQLLVLELNEAE